MRLVDRELPHPDGGLSRRRAAIASLAGLAAIVPPAVVAWVIYTYAVNVPYRDHWAFAPQVIDFWSGRYDLSQLWLPSGPHRIVVPKAVMLGLVPWTRWDVRAECWVSFALTLASFGLLVDLARRTLRPLATTAWLCTVPLMSMALFSLSAWYSWTFGWMVNVYLTVFGVALTAWALHALGTTSAGIVVMLLGAAIAAYSYLSGVVLVGLVPIAVALASTYEGRGRRVGRTLAAATGALLLLAAYLVDYPTAWVSGAAGRAMPGPVDLLLFVLRQIGSPLSDRDPAAAVAWGAFAIVVISSSIVIAWRSSPEQRRALLPWLLVAAYVCANAVLTATGRHAGRPLLALASRYAMPVAPLWAAVPACALLATCGGPLRDRPVWIRGVVAATVLAALLLANAAFVQTTVRGIQLTASRRDSLLIAASCLREIRVANDACLKRVSNLSLRVRRIAPDLTRLGLGPFSTKGEV